MNRFFIACAVLGVAVLVIRTIMGVRDTGSASQPAGGHSGEPVIGEGFQLLTLRSVAAGIGFFGIGGFAATTAGASTTITLLTGCTVGIGALVGTALLTRQVLRLDSDDDLHLEDSVGMAATVHREVPPDWSGPGKVRFAMQERTLELEAVTPMGKALATGDSVMVVSVVDPETVEVIPVSVINEVFRKTAEPSEDR
ncbi:MAG: hypothetical protein LBG44_04295 [Gemmatimonadota bacterium]|jgi:hypothetical protein|nr:hypothetical protein [Gemmatimonadota bacterium]